MTMIRSTLARLWVAAALAACGAVLASGDHAGGHAGGHGHADAAATAVGRPGVAAQVERSVEIEMSDRMRFTPATIRVRQGQTVRLVVRNAGQLKHELSLGTQAQLLEHLEQMRRAPDMDHAEPGKLSLQPGERGEIVWQFTQAGVVDFACLIPGHYEAGMRGRVQVAKR